MKNKMKILKTTIMNIFKLENYKIAALIVFFMLILGNLNISAQNMNVDATEGDYPDKVKITWEFTGFGTNPSSVEIKRDGQQIGLVQNNIILYYDDNDAIPGVIHLYEAIPHNSSGNVISASNTSDYGYVYPNGSISGTVTSPYGAGVEGVIVEAEGWVTDGNFTGLYAFYDTTNEQGEYSIDNIYYYDEATFTISPNKTAHSFTPSSRSKTLSTMGPTQASVNFTDTTVITISGVVTYANTICPVEGVTIYLDQSSTGITTNSSGEYAISINDMGNHTISCKYLHHSFSPTSITINVQDDISGIDFENTETDTLMVTLRGGCNNIIVDSAQIKLSTTSSCSYNETFYTDASGILYAIVPAQEYNVQLNNVYPFNTNITDQFASPVTIDLTERDSITEIITDTTYVTTPADTTIYANGDTIITPESTTMYTEGDEVSTAVMPRVDFIYHAGTNIEISNLPDTICVPGYNSVYFMMQNFTYPIIIQVSESYTYNSYQTTCFLDTATIDIYDDISEAGQTNVHLEDGYGFYEINPQHINLADGGDHPYQRMLQLDIGDDSEFIWAFIDGHQPRTQTFITKTPELPFFVLHDPPGDGSYSSISQGASWTRTNSLSASYGGGGGFFWDVKAGVKGGSKLLRIEFDAYVQSKGEIFIGRDNNNNTTETRTYEATESFGTSSSNLLVGHDGDVFVGGSFNMVYALTDVLEYDADNCEILRDTSLSWGMDSIQTTYIYTEEFILNTLIPNLTTLRNLATGDSVETYQNYIDVWNQVVDNNAQERIEAFEPDTTYNYIFDYESYSWEIDSLNPIITNNSENISFSGGSSYSSSTTIGESKTSTVSYTVYLNAEVSIALGFNAQVGGPYVNSQGGVKFKFNWSTSKSSSFSYSDKKTISYHLSDDDTGDYFSVDIAKDRRYGVPVFKTVAGTSSCPLEEGTQPRDTCQITLDSYVANNVPVNSSAVFTVHPLNLSQSGETRGYYIGMNTASNLDGAMIRLGGQLITAGSIYYSLEPNQNYSIPMTVTRGPQAYDYNNLEIRMYPFCFSLTEYLYAIGQYTAHFDVHFQTQCSSVSIFSPIDNWLVNQSDNNVVQIVLSDYSTNNSYLESLIIEYRRYGQEWNIAAIIDESELTQQYYDYAWDIANIPDGAYEIRAKAICDFGTSTGYTFSTISSGVIDRYSLDVFGTPEPADGILNIGDDISISFSEDIECNLASTPPEITITRDDTGEEIDIDYTCYQNTIIIEADPSTYIDSLEGVQLTASVTNIQDLSYNMFTDIETWSFIVNRSPVYWSPPNISGSATEGENGLFSANLVNEAGITKSFVISDYAGWLVPSLTGGTIVPGGNIEIDFTISNSLTSGVYYDTLISTVDGRSSLLYVTVYVLDPSPWSFINTGTNHSIFIPYNAFNSIDINDGDYIGVFYDSLGTQKCGGYIVWDSESTAISAWGTEYDNFNQSLNNGFAENEEFTWKVYKVQTGYSFTIVPSYATIDFPNAGNYVPDGLSGILGFSNVSLPGCLDPFAINYNPNATFDDGSCMYSYTAAPWTTTVTAESHTIIIYNDANRYLINGNPIETGDYIGAFYKKSDGTLSCGGYLKWDNFTNNQAITVWGDNVDYNGFASGEVFKWKVWSGSEAHEYMGYPVYNINDFTEDETFVNNGLSGLDSIITRPFQSIPLVGHPNWNLFSTYIDPDNPTAEYIFRNLEPDLQLVKNGAGQAYMPEFGVNLIGSLEIGEAYHLKMSTTDSVVLHIMGDPVDAENTVLNLPATWSYLGYLHSIPQPVTDMMSSIVNDIYLLKDGYGQSYIPQWNVNSIGNMLPGMGYQIKLLNAHSYSYPAASAAKSVNQNSSVLSGKFNSAITKTDNNMTLIIPAKAWETSPSVGNKILVYNDNNTLVGYGIYNGKNIAITIWGKDNFSNDVTGMEKDEKFTIKLLRANDNQNSDDEFISSEDAEIITVKKWIIGDDFYKANKVSIVDRIQLSSSDDTPPVCIYQNVPNPFKDKTEISFYLPEDAYVSISLYNMLGKLMDQLVAEDFTKGKHSIYFMAKNYASGTYLYKITVGNYTETKQLSIMK